MTEPLRVVVLMRHAIDPATVDPEPDTGAPNKERILRIVDPASDRALRVALELKSRQGSVVHVIALVAGVERAEAVARHALSLGAHAAYRVHLPEEADETATAGALVSALEALGPIHLVLAGDESADGGSALVPPLVAEMAGLRYAGEAELEFDWIDDPATPVRLVRFGRLGRRWRTTVELPAVISIRHATGPKRLAPLDPYRVAMTAVIPTLPGPSASPTWRAGAAGTRRVPAPAMDPPSGSDPEERIRSLTQSGSGRRHGQLVSGATSDLVRVVLEDLRAAGFALPRTGDRTLGERRDAVP